MDCKSKKTCEFRDVARNCCTADPHSRQPQFSKNQTIIENHICSEKNHRSCHQKFSLRNPGVKRNHPQPEKPHKDTIRTVSQKFHTFLIDVLIAHQKLKKTGRDIPHYHKKHGNQEKQQQKIGIYSDAEPAKLLSTILTRHDDLPTPAAPVSHRYNHQIKCTDIPDRRKVIFPKVK